MKNLIPEVIQDSALAVITDLGEIYTYGNLRELISKIVSHIDRRRVSICLCTNSIGSLTGYLAFVEGHLPAIMLDGSKDSAIIQNIIDIYNPRYIWVPDKRVREFEGRDTVQLLGYTLIERDCEELELHPDLALLLTTSGSTGSPKLVKLTLNNLLSNAESIATYLDITPAERPITTLPMHYSFGLSVINSHLIKGATILLTDKTVMQKEFWKFAKESGATSLSGVPYTYEMLHRLRFFEMDLPKLTSLTQAGGKLNAKLAKEFASKSIACGKRFIIMYGQTEATARISYLPASDSPEKYTSIGIVIPGGRLFLINSDGNEITEPGIDGELIYEGPNVSMGYAECIEDLSTEDVNHGVLHTGDLAHRDTAGYYYITGRLKRFVKIWGNRCNLDAVEELLKTCELRDDGTGNTSITSCNLAVTGIDDKITVFTTQTGFDAKIKAFLSEKTGLNPRAFSVKAIAAIPKTNSGKTNYAELQKLLD